MRTVRAYVFASLMGASFSPSICQAQEAAEPAVEPAAVAALEKMAAHLRTLEQFEVTVANTIDDVMEGGQLAEISGRTVYQVRRPDRMKAEVTTDRSQRVFYYDGSTVTQFSPALGYYSVFEAAPTIAETLDIAQEKYDVELPLADLFYWGTERNNLKDITAAFAVGDARISGETCTHYAYRADVTDFQVWIRKHGDPLPCRLVIVTTDDDARPRYSATFEWNIDPMLGDTVFTFAAPPGAQKVEQEQIQAEAN